MMQEQDSQEHINRRIDIESPSLMGYGEPGNLYATKVERDNDANNGYPILRKFISQGMKKPIPADTLIQPEE